MKLVLKKIGFFSAFVIPTLVVTGYYLGGYWNYLPLFFSFIFMPLLDQAFGVDKSNVPENDVRIVGEDFFYRFVTYCWTYFQIPFLFWGAYVVASGGLHGVHEWVGFLLSFSLVTGGIGITVAHELGHKKSSIERLYGRALLMTVCYMHFYIEHNRGHHVYVATPADPATARKSESFYRFWIRSVFNGWKHAWHLERERLKKINASPYSLRNEMIWYTVLPVLFCAVLTATVGFSEDAITWNIPFFFFAQSFLALTLLELVNYVEHYGIQRKEITPGRYERVNPLHSWNASQLLSNFFLFQLQRHSDHHAAAHKRYQVLNHYDESPQLPFGYPTMIMIALLPPLWFSMMDQRLERWQSVSLRESA